MQAVLRNEEGWYQQLVNLGESDKFVSAYSLDLTRETLAALNTEFRELSTKLREAINRLTVSYPAAQWSQRIAEYTQKSEQSTIQAGRLQR